MYELVQLASLFSSGPNKDSINRFLVVQGSSIFKIFKKYHILDYSILLIHIS